MLGKRSKTELHPSPLFIFETLVLELLILLPRHHVWLYFTGVLFCFVWDKLCLCSPDWHPIPCPLVSTFQVLRSQACATMLGILLTFSVCRL